MVAYPFAELSSRGISGVQVLLGLRGAGSVDVELKAMLVVMGVA